MSSSWFELRVHGVSGTPPESMLDFQRVRQESGDEFGRFFRRIDEYGAELREPDGHRVEAYHWGKFTSGSWSQALWLLIAPFGIVNAAQFMLEPPTSGFSRFCHTVAGASLRLVGLVLTALFVLGVAVITVDLWSWQLVGDSETFPQRFVPAVALLGPVTVVALFVFFGRARLVATRTRSAAIPTNFRTPPMSRREQLSGPRREQRSGMRSRRRTSLARASSPATTMCRRCVGCTSAPVSAWWHCSASHLENKRP